MTQLPMRPQAVRAAIEQHPDVLSSVTLTLRASAAEPVALVSRVLDLEVDDRGTTVVVVDPPDGFDPLDHLFDTTLTWTYPLGRMEVAVATIPARRRYGRVWLLRPTAAPIRRQERAYFRARLAVPGLFEWTELPDDDPDGGVDHSVSGVVADLSEGGMLLVTRGTLPVVDSVVRALVHLDGDVLAQDARVVRRVSLSADGAHGAGVAFIDPAVHGDRIRRAVFEAERRRLRS